MIINNRTDLDAAPADVKQNFMAKLASSIHKWDWVDGAWVAVQDTTSIEQFDFSLSDFPDAPKPKKPTYNPDERQAEQEAKERITQLKGLLRETDYVSLPDYDKEKPEVITQRAEWREELRALEAQYVEAE